MVARLRATLAGDAFADSSPMEQPFGIRPQALRKVLTDTDQTALEYDADTRKLALVSGSCRYTHSALSADTIRNSDGPPDMDLGFEAELSGDQFREVVEWFDGFTTYLRMGYDPSDRRFWIEANERRGGSIGTDDGCFELSRSDLDYVRDAGHADSMFSIDYTRDIAAAIPEGRTVTIRVGEEYPMILSYSIHDADGAACGRVEFMQAPRVQSE
jgi:hypothetical protein